MTKSGVTEELYLKGVEKGEASYPAESMPIALPFQPVANNLVRRANAERIQKWSGRNQELQTT